MSRIGVVTFPGTLDEQNACRAIKIAGGEPVALWHATDSLEGVEAVILPGGHSYGNYLRSGAIARFSPVMGSIIAAANKGLPVLGVGNGFQVLCEAELLPGALLRNADQKFICKDQRVRIESNDTVWTCDFLVGQEITIALKSGESNYQADSETIKALENHHQIVLRYLDGNPNGSASGIAGITNQRGNVVGLMPQPEHNVEELTGASTDGLGFFSSVLKFLQHR